jgi:hypothetical protein
MINYGEVCDPNNNGQITNNVTYDVISFYYSCYCLILTTCRAVIATTACIRCSICIVHPVSATTAVWQ